MKNRSAVHSCALSLLALASVCLAGEARSSANDVVLVDGRLHVTIDDAKDAGALYQALNVREESADEGTIKALDVTERGESLRLYCNFDHNTSCQLVYRNDRRPLVLTEEGRAGYFGLGREISDAMMAALDVPVARGFGLARKSFMTRDAALEIECAESRGGENHCSIEVLKPRH